MEMQLNEAISARLTELLKERVLLAAETRETGRALRRVTLAGMAVTLVLVTSETFWAMTLPKP